MGANVGLWRLTSGIILRHLKECKSQSDGRCNCRPTYQASVWSKRDQRRIKKSFATIAEAKAWRAETQTAVRRGTMRAPSQLTLREASTSWLEGVRAGTIRNRSGDRYKPSVIRGYETSLRKRLLPELGGKRISDIHRADVQGLVDRMLGKQIDPSTIRNSLMPLRAIFRRAVARGEVAVNPTSGLELPAIRGRRDRIVAPDQGARLIEALAPRDRALGRQRSTPASAAGSSRHSAGTMSTSQRE